jgi:hypothetical protein
MDNGLAHTMTKELGFPFCIDEDDTDEKMGQDKDDIFCYDTGWGEDDYEDEVDLFSDGYGEYSDEDGFFSDERDEDEDYLDEDEDE